MNIIYKILIILILTVSINFSSNAEWKYIGVNTTGTSFYVDNGSIKLVNGNYIIKQLQNKKKPDKWGSLSTIVNKELDCTRNLFRISSMEFYFGSMGTNFEKQIPANDQGWKVNTDKSMNKMVSNFVCKNQNIKSIKKHKLPNCNKNIAPRSWNNCFGTFEYQNGDIYVGDFKNGQYHGNGRYTFSLNGNFAGQAYTGEWLYGKRNGTGINVWGDGEKYIGEWKKDKRDGFGTNFYSDGKVEKGIWRNGKLSSKSSNFSIGSKNKKFSKREVNSSLPDCTDNNKYKHNCYTTVINSTRKYSGEFKNNKFNGLGKYTHLANDDFKNYTHIGSYIDNKRHGRGKATHTNGDVYIGEYKFGKKDGYGRTQYSDGDFHKGYYRNGKRDGKGKYKFANGDYYEGEFENDKYTGLGKFTFANGNYYDGEWKDNKYNGQGKFIYKSGRVKEGIWKDNKLLYFQKTDEHYKAVKPELKFQPKISEKKIINVSSGTGFAISTKGYLITNYHVIKGCEKINIHNKELVTEAIVISFDPQNDLALIKGDFKPNNILSISNKQTNLLQDIYVAGFPFGKKISTSIKITKGIVSSLTGVGNNYSNFQIDAAIQPGNSGGPILNEKGNVIGVAVAKLDLQYASKNFGVIPENTNFGIKSSVVKSILESENIKTIEPSNEPISKIELGNKITNSTFYISCWMSHAQINKMKSKKVIYNKY